MLPGTPGHYHPNRRSADREPPSQLPHARPGRAQPAQFVNLRPRQFRMGVCFPTHQALRVCDGYVAALGPRVALVVRMRAQEEVIWPDATAVIAARTIVADTQAVGNRPMGELIRQPMSGTGPNAPQVYVAVPPVTDRAEPEPTLPGLIYPRPETRDGLRCILRVHPYLLGMGAMPPAVASSAVASRCLDDTTFVVNTLRCQNGVLAYRDGRVREITARLLDDASEYNRRAGTLVRF